MTSDVYAPRSPADVADLILAHPLAWVTSSGADGPRATLLPVVPIFGDDGALVRLDGHFARRNPQLDQVRCAPTGLFLFSGPNAYVSPSWFHDRSQAPTWNYASVQVLAKLSWYEDEAGLEAHLRDLIGQNEAGRPNAWTLDEMGERFRRIVRGIVGFHAEVIEVRARFKMGQDERDDVFADMVDGLDGLDAHDSAAVAGWMKRLSVRGRD
jgi:transcriptional regulator